MQRLLKYLEFVTYDHLIAIDIEVQTDPVPVLKEVQDAVFKDDEKPFPCLYCSKSYTRKNKLKTHMEKIHNCQLETVYTTVERSYVCSVCGKSYTMKHNLNRHMLSHEKLPVEVQPIQASLDLSEYEQIRERNIQENRRYLKSLDVFN